MEEKKARLSASALAIGFFFRLMQENGAVRRWTSLRMNYMIHNCSIWIDRFVSITYGDRDFVS